MTKRVFFVVLTLAAWCVQAQESHVQASLMADRSAIERGVPFQLGVTLKMQPHWHTYWENPGSSGLPTQVSWEAVDGLTLGPLRFPTPRKFVDSVGFVTYGFEDRVVLIVEGIYTGSADQIVVKGRVEWLECKDVCLPGSASVRLELPVEAETQLDPSFDQHVARLPVDARKSGLFTVASNIEFLPDRWRGTLRLKPKNHATWGSEMSRVRFFPGPSAVAELTKTRARLEGQSLVLDLEYEVFDSSQPPEPRIWGVVQADLDGRGQAFRVQVHPDSAETTHAQEPAMKAAKSDEPSGATPAGNDWRQLADDFTITAATTGYQGVDSFLGFLSGESQGTFEGKSIWLIMLLVLVGGLALNLTPCVLPLIPINLSIIGAGAQAGTRSRGFALGGMYGLGICLVYGMLGLVVILGLSSAFGALNAKPWFNAAIAVIFVVLALAMFDVLSIDFTRYQTKLGVTQKPSGGLLLPLTMGAVSALLAGACVAPVVISTIVYAQDQFTKGVVVALALPFLLGLGMAIPWPFAGSGLSLLPKPGKWMVRIKQAFGVLILGFALYYGYLAYSLVRPHDATPTESSLWTHSLTDGLNRAKREGKPVVIDFWATWCKNCLTMDKTTFKNERVQAALQDFVPVKVQAEDLDAPETAEMLDYFGAKGLPTYVLLTPNAER